MRAGCAVQTSKPVTSNAQVLSSLPGHHLATSLVGLHTQYMHPKYCGFSLLWVCVWSAPSKPQWDRACWPSCGELWLRKHRTAWMPAAMTTRHGAVWRHRHGSNATWQGCLHNGATKVPLGAVSARWLSGAIAAYANIGKLAWVPAVESQFKVGQLLRIVFRTCAMAVCSPHYHIFTWFTSNQGIKLCFAQNQFALNLEKAQRKDCSLSWKFPLPMCLTLGHRSTNLFLQGNCMSLLPLALCSLVW